MGDTASAEAEFQGTERFEVLRRIGTGGMGVVYEALDRERNVVVALKTLRAFNPDALLRFKQEFRALQDLQHENLVTLGELVEHGGHWFFTMELIRGVNFLQWVRPRSSAGLIDDTVLDGASEATEVLNRPLQRLEPTMPKRELPQVPVSFDEERLRSALAQLAQGVHALHQRRMVHRDIKPSNILVTSEGRVVLLDFGLITATTGDRITRDGKLVGTAAFMAPEQAQGRIEPASDWYAIGALLYLALTGRLPFDGRPSEVLALKERIEPIPPLAIVPEVPRDLDRLCVDLLRMDPAQRPTGEEILRRLRAEAAGGAPPPPFVGRRRELDLLADAYAAVSDGHAVLVCVEGDSGVGKSALAHRFAEMVAARDPDVLVLSGRCYERESVPYKAFDGIVDELCHHLETLPKAQAAPLLSKDAPLLVQAFPQLARVEVLADASGPLGSNVVDVRELRRRVFAAMRDLLGRLAIRRRLLLTIDDLQWADADSVALLGEVLRGPEAPRILLIATARDDLAAAHPELARTVSDVRRLSLSGLPPEEAVELATRLMGRRAAMADALIAAAAGHPLFIDELVRQVSAAEVEADTTPQPVRLEDALWRRVERLDVPGRTVVEVVVVAGAPLRQQTAAEAAQLDAADFARCLAVLRAARLVRTRGVRASDYVEPYHDRVRQAVLAHLPPERRARLHERLAVALEKATAADFEAIGLHWREAGDNARAARFLERAADRAAHALAFERAARLYRLAADLGPPERAAELGARLGEALGNAGAGAQAAEAYLDAARRLSGDEALELRRRAALHLLFSGRFDEGLRELEAVLRGLGLSLPATPRRALASLLVKRAQIRLRGLRFRARSAREIPPVELARIDTAYAVATGLGLVDIIRGAEFQARHILLALKAGERARLARALALESSYAAARGEAGRARADQLVARATELARQSAEPAAEAWVLGISGFNHLQRGEWKPALELLARAEDLIRERTRGMTWELSTVQVHRLFALALLGELNELAERGRRYLRAAESRGDLYASTLLRVGPLIHVWLAAGDPVGGRQDVEQALRQWSQRGYHLQHFHAMTARAQCALFTGDGAAALRVLDEGWAPLEESLLLHFQINRVNVLELRARAAIAAAQRETGAARRELVARALTDIWRIEREREPCTQPLLCALRAGLAMIEGMPERALPLITEAERGFADRGMTIYVACARRRRGQLLGGDEGERLIAEAEAALALQNVRDGARTGKLFTPGFAD